MLDALILIFLVIKLYEGRVLLKVSGFEWRLSALLCLFVDPAAPHVLEPGRSDRYRGHRAARRAVLVSLPRRPSHTFFAHDVRATIRMFTHIP